MVVQPDVVVAAGAGRLLAGCWSVAAAAAAGGAGAEGVVVVETDKRRPSPSWRRLDVPRLQQPLPALAEFSCSRLRVVRAVGMSQVMVLDERGHSARIIRSADQQISRSADQQIRSV